jgi:hypothetical protein
MKEFMEICDAFLGISSTKDIATPVPKKDVVVKSSNPNINKNTA